MMMQIEDRGTVAAALYDAGCRIGDLTRAQTIMRMCEWNPAYTYVVVDDDRWIWAAQRSDVSHYMPVNSAAHLIRYLKIHG